MVYVYVRSNNNYDCTHSTIVPFISSGLGGGGSAIVQVSSITGGHRRGVLLFVEYCWIRGTRHINAQKEQPNSRHVNKIMRSRRQFSTFARIESTNTQPTQHTHTEGIRKVYVCESNNNASQTVRHIVDSLTVQWSTFEIH